MEQQQQELLGSIDGERRDDELAAGHQLRDGRTGDPGLPRHGPAPEPELHGFTRILFCLKIRSFPCNQ